MPADPAVEAAAWADVFRHGQDTGGEVRALGITTDSLGCPDLGSAHAAWRRLGRHYLAHQPEAQCWARRRFGEPRWTD